MILLAVWSFASPWMLPWLAAVAIPVAIHLWSRRRYQDEAWAATQFLLAAIRKHQRRLTVEQMLLLAIRVLVLVLLAIALAEPMLSGWPIGTTTTDEPPRFTVLVIDTSYSMGFQEKGRSRFEHATQLATDSVRRAKPGDAFALVTLSEPPSVVVAQPSANHAAIVDEIDKLELSHAGADLSPTLHEVANLLNAVAESQSRFLDRRVEFLTDLGRTTWQAATTPECRQQLNDLNNLATLEFLHTGSVKANNLAVTRIETDGRAVVGGEAFAIHVEIENAGAANENQKRIELFVDERKVGEKHVNVAASARAGVSFNQQIDVPGDREMVARLSSDGLSVDDSRWLIVPVRETIRVLCIEGKLNAAAYVALALNPSDETAMPRQVQVVSEYALLEKDLHAYDCVFMCNVARLGPTEATVLRDYVASGGGLVVALGDIVNANSYNDQLSAADDRPLLPLMLKSVTTGEPRYFVADGYEHPLVKPFRGHQRAGLLTVPVWSYWQFDKLAEEAEVALRFGNNEPAIVASTFGRGRVVVVSTALSPESVNTSDEGTTPWNALPAWPSFPPLVHELVHFATKGMQDRRNIIVGEGLASRFLADEAEDDFSLQCPDGIEIRPDEINQTGWSLAETTQSGVYRAAQATTNRSERFAANLDTKESDLVAIDRELLAEFASDESVVVREASENPVSLFRSMLTCMIVLLVIETVLAWSFGRAKAM